MSLTRSRAALSFVAALLLVTPGCDDGSTEADAGSDASTVRPDGGADAGTDAGPVGEDAGPPDAGPPDAGPVVDDAGSSDAGPPDAGPPDAGPPDAGPPDAGPACLPTGILTVTNSGFSSWSIDGASDPTLVLCRGNTYTFRVNAPGHPFWIKTVASTGTANAYSTGVTGNGTQAGDVVFTVGAGAPDTLFYNCQFHAAMTGQLTIVN